MYSIGNIENIQHDCDEAAREGYGYLHGEHSLDLHVSLLDTLPPILRVYVGCADMLSRCLSHADMIKIHIHSGKVTFSSYDDFYGSAVPELRERVKVSLWQRKVEYFDYIGPFEPRPLLFKSLYLPESSEHYDSQAEFDRQLMKLGIFNATSEGPARQEFYRKLRQTGYYIRDFQLLPDVGLSCGWNYTFRDFFECSDAYKRSPLKNIPTRRATYDAIKLLCDEVLDPVIHHFGSAQLTYGYGSSELTKKIRRRVAPNRDQHAGYEMRSDGSRICDRGGFACDFMVPEVSSRTVAAWIVRNTNFDRLYYYGAERPLHVSVNHAPKGQCVIVNRGNTGHSLPPTVLSSDRFIERLCETS